MHQDDKGNWVANYIIKSPRECKSIVVKPEDLKYRVLMIHKDKKNLRGTNVLKYIQEGESKGYHLRPTCASRERWYDLGVWQEPHFVWSDAYNDRFGVYDTCKTWGDKRFFYITLQSEGNFVSVESYLNSSIVPLLIEIDGITSLGEGAVYTNVYWLKKLRVSPFRGELESKLKPILEKLESRRILSIFSELGASVTEEVSLDKVKPDRRELDKIIMGEILGLSDEEQLEVCRAVVDLVKSRIERAKSFGKMRKTKEGIDIDLLVKTVMGKLSEDTLGKFYREKILSHKPLRSRSLPRVSGEVKLEQELFGWRLSSGRERIDCASEMEARYLKVWLETGLGSIKLPKDEGYLGDIVPELESLKQTIDDVFGDYLGSILDSRLRQRLLHQLWQEATK